MKFGRFELVLFVLFNLLVSSPAGAQWQTPNHSVPVGRGAGITGFGSVGPCTAGVPLVGQGAAADPTCAALDLGGSGATGLLPVTRLPSVSGPAVLANPSTAAAQIAPQTPQQFNQGGFTGMVPCGAMAETNLVMVDATSVTGMFTNNVGWIALCNGFSWVASTGWWADGPGMRVINLAPSTSAAHSSAYINTIGGAGSCTATGVSTNTQPGCNDPDFPCAAQGTPTDCYLFVVGTMANPPAENATNNSWGLVWSRRDCHSGPGTTVQTVFPYYSCFGWNRTIGSATVAGEQFLYLMVKVGNRYTFTGTNAGGHGALFEVANGVKSQWSALFLAGLTSPGTKAVTFMLHNTVTGTVCAIAPDATWGSGPLASNPGNTDVWLPVPDIASDAGAYGMWSTSTGCHFYILGFTDTIGDPG